MEDQKDKTSHTDSDLYEDFSAKLQERLVYAVHKHSLNKVAQMSLVTPGYLTSLVERRPASGPILRGILEALEWTCEKLEDEEELA